MAMQYLQQEVFEKRKYTPMFNHSKLKVLDGLNQQLPVTKKIKIFKAMRGVSTTFDFVRFSGVIVNPGSVTILQGCRLGQKSKKMKKE